MDSKHFGELLGLPCEVIIEHEFLADCELGSFLFRNEELIKNKKNLVYIYGKRLYEHPCEKCVRLCECGYKIPSITEKMDTEFINHPNYKQRINSGMWTTYIFETPEELRPALFSLRESRDL